MKRWNLDDLYVSFEDYNYQNDLKRLEKILDDLKQYPSLKNNEKNLITYLKLDNECQDIVERLFGYTHLVMNANTQDMKAIQYASKLENMLASFADTNTHIQQWISKFDLSLVHDDYIKEHEFVLKEIQEQQKYMLSSLEEVAIAKMKTTGSSSWLKYKDQLISSMKVVMDNKEYPLTEVLNMAYSKNKDIRKKAYEAEIESYKNVEQGIASSLNAIKGEAITISEMRGYDSILQRTLIDSRMSQKTLDALLNTIKKALPMFEKYFQAKAKKLGYTNGLPWYEMYAPVIEVNSEYSYEEGCQYVIEQFLTFSNDLGNYAKTAIEKEWIDVYPRDSKVGGAFCQNLHCIQQSRFLLNYGNDFSDVITIGHELGHGYHGYCLNEQTAFNSDYPMPIAETASTFCETIIKKAALQKANKAEKLMILENELCDCAQVIVDIYSRFLFESRFIEKRKDGPLSVEDIKELMIEAQKEAYGSGLDHDYLHPYMWTWKPHYYEVDYAFYNFPYAFGLLLAKGLYGMYQKQGQSFSEIYKHLLSLTGKMNLEDVCQNVGIDITSEEFWKNSIDMIEEDLTLFYELL